MCRRTEGGGSKLVEDVLDAWREGERLLDELPPLAADHETVRMAVERLPSISQDMTAAKAATREKVDDSHETIAVTREVIERERRRLSAA